MALPLTETKVIDLTRLLPGPFCTLLLADMGAEVIKVEEPKRGDYVRWMPPLMENGESVSHFLLNRNKKSVAIDLKTREGKEMLMEMAQWTDVLVESFRPGVMGRLGLSYETLEEVNPGIVYCSITGYGQTGPYRDWVGHDINYIGYAGLLYGTGHSDGPPVVPGAQIADCAGGGLMGALSILAALIERGRSGRGQHLDVSMTDGCVALNVANTGELFTRGVAPRRGELPLWGEQPYYSVYETLDGQYMAVGAIEGKFWARLCELLGLPELAERQFDFQDYPRIKEELREKFKEKTRDDWARIFEGEEACVSPVKSLDEVMKDPQVEARDMVTKMDGPDGKPTKTLGMPIKFSRTPSEIRSPAPSLGEHTDEILGRFGCSEEELAGLREKGIIR